MGGTRFTYLKLSTGEDGLSPGWVAMSGPTLNIGSSTRVLTILGPLAYYFEGFRLL